MIKTIKNALTDVVILKKIMIAVIGLFVIRVFSHIPVPWVDVEMLRNTSSNDLLSFTNMFNGSKIASYTFGATGVSSYISASIMMQLLTFFIKPLHKLKSEPGGQKYIKKITITMGIIFAFLVSIITTKVLDSQYSVLLDDSWYVFVIIAIIHAACTGISIAIGETITEFGFCDGLSLIILSNILASMPVTFELIFEKYEIKEYSFKAIVVFAVTMVVIYLLVAIMENTEERISMVYPKNIARQTKFTKASNFFPIRLNILGVMPLILAVYIYQFASWIIQVTGNEIALKILDNIQYGTMLYPIVTSVLMLFATMFYTGISIDANEIAYHLQIRGCIIPGLRQGKTTSRFLKKEINKMAIIGAFYLIIITMVPMLILTAYNIDVIETTSIIIMFDVSIMVVRTLNTEIKLRHVKQY